MVGGKHTVNILMPLRVLNGCQLDGGNLTCGVHTSLFHFFLSMLIKFVPYCLCALRVVLDIVVGYTTRMKLGLLFLAKLHFRRQLKT